MDDSYTDPSSGSPGCKPWAVITTIQWHLSHHTMPITRSIPAIACGLALGMLITSFMQKHLNSQARYDCNKPGISDAHRLVMLTSVVGDTYACMHIRYLGN